MTLANYRWGDAYYNFGYRLITTTYTKAAIVYDDDVTTCRIPPFYMTMYYVVSGLTGKGHTVLLAQDFRLALPVFIWFLLLGNLLK